MQYELFYGYIPGTDGHCGPFQSIAEAEEYGRRWLSGTKTGIYCLIRERDPSRSFGEGRIVSKVVRESTQSI